MIVWVKIETIKDEIKGLAEEEQEACNNMPESFQYGERGDKCQEAIDALNDAVGKIEGIDDETEVDNLVSISQAVIYFIEDASN